MQIVVTRQNSPSKKKIKEQLAKEEEKLVQSTLTLQSKILSDKKKLWLLESIILKLSDDPEGVC